MKKIEPYRLWLGHAGDGRDIARIVDTGIEAVVQLAEEEPLIALPRSWFTCVCRSMTALQTHLNIFSSFFRRWPI